MTPALRLVLGPRGGAVAPPVEGLHTIVETDTLKVEAEAGAARHQRPDGSRVIVVGHVLGERGADGALRPLATRDVLPDQGAGATRLPRVEGRYLVVDLASDGTAEVWADALGQRDLYRQDVGPTTVLATSLDLLPVARSGAGLDQVALAHAMTVYGYRPPKRHTFYQGVSRLGVGEGVRLANGAATTIARPFVPVSTGAYEDADLGRYADTLIEAVRARASADGNVVLLSSGWDSTAILACLVHLFGPSKVRAVVGRMVYAERSGVVNQFEVDRARAMAEFFGIPLSVVDFDYRRTAPEQIERVKPLLRTQQMAGITALNHWILADHAAATGRGGEAVFAGEMSDGAHNLGFSQYATYFHPVVEFREYFDKMASYLHGPTFLSLLHQDQFAADPIYQLMRARTTATYDGPAPTLAGRTRQLIASCLLRGVRVPLASMGNTKLMTARGLERFTREIEEVYLTEAAEQATPATLYSWYLRLYNSLHWQGSTVATIPMTVESRGLRCALPYHDQALLDFLAAMPESWGRGLDLRPTKYPLKHMLATRVRYPMHLQTGPHSYLYDIDPTFNHSAEAMYGSSMREYFTSRLRSGEYEGWIAGEVFDADYVRGLVTQYLDGFEIRGPGMHDLWNLCVMTMTGFYGH
jgi:hypothetical protein